MAKRIHRFSVPVLFVLLIFGIEGVFRHSISATIYPQSAANVIATGKNQLFSQNVSETLQAYQTFRSAVNGDYYNTATNPEKIKLRVYLAAARMFDVVAREDGGDADTLAEIMSKYGVKRTGEEFDEVEIDFPLNNNDDIILPATAPDSADELMGFFAGPFLKAIDASIADLDEAIALCPESAQGDDVEIIEKELIDDEDQDQNIEMDCGDYWLFRSGLKSLKASVLMSVGYNTTTDIRQIAALINMDAGVECFKDLLDRHPDFLKISDNEKLNEARLTLINAITDYETASEKIRGDEQTTSGAEELFSIEPEDRQVEAVIRENIAKIKDSLQYNQIVEIIETNEDWTFTNEGQETINVEFEDTFTEGWYETSNGTSHFGSWGELDYAIVEGNSIESHFTYYSPQYGQVTFKGTFTDSNKSQITGTYSGWNSMDGDYSGNFTGTKKHSETEPFLEFDYDEGSKLNFYPLFGDGTPGTQKSPRDMLPQISERGCFVPGTVGHGLDDDPTLGGIMPEYTQDMWLHEDEVIVECFGSPDDITIPTIPARTINVQDSSVDDWETITPVCTNVLGELDEPNDNLRHLYLAKDSDYLYIRADSDGESIPPWFYLKMKKRPEIKDEEDDDELEGNVEIRYNPPYYYERYWVGKWIESEGYYEHFYIDDNNVQLFDNHIEMKVPLEYVGDLGGRYVSAGLEEEYDEGGIRCLRIQPTADITGTLEIPNYDGSGLVHVGVVQCAGEERLRGLVIYPDSSNKLPAMYSLPGLPVGEEVYVSLFWDRDKNGIVTPGDYIGNSKPFTMVAGTNRQNMMVGDVSNDGDVDLEDALLALQVVSGMKPAVALDGDVNADNRIDLRDALYILQKLSGLR